MPIILYTFARESAREEFDGFSMGSFVGTGGLYLRRKKPPPEETGENMLHAVLNLFLPHHAPFFTRTTEKYPVFSGTSANFSHTCSSAIPQLATKEADSSNP